MPLVGTFRSQHAMPTLIGIGVRGREAFAPIIQEKVFFEQISCKIQAFCSFFIIPKSQGLKHRQSRDLGFRQESRADAGVSVRQRRHLAINYELGFSIAIEALTCAATWRKR